MNIARLPSGSENTVEGDRTSRVMYCCTVFRMKRSLRAGRSASVSSAWVDKGDKAYIESGTDCLACWRNDWDSVPRFDSLASSARWELGLQLGSIGAGTAVPLEDMPRLGLGGDVEKGRKESPGRSRGKRVGIHIGFASSGFRNDASARCGEACDLPPHDPEERTPRFVYCTRAEFTCTRLKDTTVGWRRSPSCEQRRSPGLETSLRGKLKRKQLVGGLAPPFQVTQVMHLRMMDVCCCSSLGRRAGSTSVCQGVPRDGVAHCGAALASIGVQIASLRS